MKKLLFLLLFLPFFGFSQGGTWPVKYGDSDPSGAPSAAGTRLYFNTATNTLFFWEPAPSSTWRKQQKAFDQITGCAAPAYTPTARQSTFAVNSCTVPELYQWTGAAWALLNPETLYTAGTGIDITGGVISNTAPNVVQELSISGQDLTLSGGGGTVAIPGASLSGTTGQIPYFNSTTTITTENGTGTNNLTWDATNNRLGVGTASPSHRVHISGEGQAFKFNNAAADGFAISQLTTNSWAWSGLSGGMFFNLENADFILPPSQGSVGIGTDYSTTPTAKLDVVGAQGYSQLRLRTSYTPTSTADALGNTGSVAWDTNYFYIKTSAGWKRAALTTF